MKRNYEEAIEDFRFLREEIPSSIEDFHEFNNED
jgi:hypothetical protein